MNDDFYDDQNGLLVDVANIKNAVDNLGHAVADQRHEDALAILANITDSIGMIARSFQKPAGVS